MAFARRRMNRTGNEYTVYTLFNCFVLLFYTDFKNIHFSTISREYCAAVPFPAPLFHRFLLPFLFPPFFPDHSLEKKHSKGWTHNDEWLEPCVCAPPKEGRRAQWIVGRRDKACCLHHSASACFRQSKTTTPHASIEEEWLCFFPRLKVFVQGVKMLTHRQP